MGRGKKYQPEQVVNLLRQIEAAVSNGKTTPQACKEAGIVEQTYFRWRKEFGAAAHVAGAIGRHSAKTKMPLTQAGIQLGPRVWSLRLSADHSAAASLRRQAGWQGPGGENLSVAEGLKVPQKAEAARPAMAQRWLLCEAAADTPEPCMELVRLHGVHWTHDGRSVRILNLIDEHTRRGVC